MVLAPTPSSTRSISKGFSCMELILTRPQAAEMLIFSYRVKSARKECYRGGNFAKGEECLRPECGSSTVLKADASRSRDDSVLQCATWAAASPSRARLFGDSWFHLPAVPGASPPAVEAQDDGIRHDRVLCIAGQRGQRRG